MDKVREIRISGAERISEDTILSEIELKAGAPYDATRADRSVHALYATGNYKDVRIENKAGLVVITVVENSVVGAVSFVGNSDVKSDKLQAALKLKAGAPFSPARAHADANAIRDLYRREGRMTTEVQPKVTEKPGNKVDVAFLISEGKVNRISSITFEGNYAFKSSELESAISSARSSWLDILKSDSVYASERLDVDRELLRKFYLTRGYADVKVLRAEGALDETGAGYDLKFVVEEGELITIGRVTVDSEINGIDLAAMNGQVLIREGSPYNAELIDKSTEALSLALWEADKKFARVAPTFKRDSAHRIAHVTFAITDGPHVTIERIGVSGNSKTRDYVVRREMKLAEGGPYNPLILERDKERIRRLGYFKSVEAKVSKGSNADQVAIDVEVVEDGQIDVSVGAGYGTAQGLMGDIGIEDHNLFGRGQTAKLKLAGSAIKLQAEAGFSEPHLLGTNLEGGFDLFYKDYDQSEQSSFKSRRIGGDVRLGYAITDALTGSVNYTFTQNKIYNVGALASQAVKEAVPGFPGKTSNIYYASSVGYSLAYDTRDRRRLPSMGSYFLLSQDFAGAGGDVRYIKTAVDLRNYQTVMDGVTLVTRGTAGTITGWGGADVRLLDMFQMGGETVRGFAIGGLGPRDTASVNKDALGGTSYISTTTEMRFGLPLVPESFGLRGSVFADAGSLFGTSASAAKIPGIAGTGAALRASAGAGLIWDSPIGPLQATYAFPLAKQAFDKTQPFGFGLPPF